MNRKTKFSVFLVWAVFISLTVLSSLWHGFSVQLFFALLGVIVTSAYAAWTLEDSDVAKLAKELEKSWYVEEKT